MERRRNLYSVLVKMPEAAADDDDANIFDADDDDGGGDDDDDDVGDDKKRLSWFCAPLVCAPTPTNRLC